jgi:assimilatory nitrate reductase catalytic subunit
MGGREVGGMATLMSGHRDLANSQHRAKWRAVGHRPRARQPGRTAVDMFAALAPATSG